MLPQKREQAFLYKGSKPEFASPMYEKFVVQLNHDLGKQVYTGIFAADMKVDLCNDGPFNYHRYQEQGMRKIFL
jgi:D-Tyr-tRNAtyr deacylase